MVVIYSEPFEKWKCVFRDCSAACCTAGREVTAGDIKRISEAIDKTPEEFADLKDEKGHFRLKGVGKRCIFLNEDSTCQIHETGVKPILCRMYPFRFDGIVYSDEVILKVGVVKDCPGFGKGEKSSEELEVLIEGLGNKFVSETKAFLKLKHQEGLSNKEIIDRIEG